MDNIKFGTDGWRAIIAREYTIENVRRVAFATAKWMQSKNYTKLVIGYDCRFGGKMFMREVATLCAEQNIQCYVSENFVSTPMVSLAVVQLKADLGIVITASHNPPDYNGFKLKSAYGGPTIPSEIAEVEALIPNHSIDITTEYEQQKSNGKIISVDFEEHYIRHVQNNFDLEKIRNSVSVAYDSMYGAGQHAMRKLIPEALKFHCEHNPGFNSTPPEPVTKNLTEICEFLKKNPGKYVGIANDGDADRIAMIDEEGNMVDSHHILLLLLFYLVKYKNMTGKIVVSCSVTNKLKKLAEHFGLQTDITKIGFKYIAEKMIIEDVIVGGEESGGLAIKGHIPERDGIWIGLTILEFMAKTGKTIRQLIDEVYAITGPFSYDRLDLHLKNEQMHQVRENLSNGVIANWGKFQTKNYDNLDGEKYFFEHDAWLMFRASGTEPVLRIYAQGRNEQEVKDIHQAALNYLNLNP